MQRLLSLACAQPQHGVSWLALSGAAAAVTRVMTSSSSALQYSCRAVSHTRGGSSGFGRAGGARSSAAASPQSSSGRDRSRGRGGPLKDRYPHMLVDRSDPRRRLAVLVDGTNTNLLRAGSRGNGTDGEEEGAGEASATRDRSSLYATVLPSILKVGVPVLLRLFAYELPAEWAPLLVGTPAFDAVNGAHSTSTSAATLLSLPASDSAVTRGAASGSSSSASLSAAAPQIQFEFFRVERFIPIPMQIEADAQHLFDFRRQNMIEGVCYVCHEVDRAMYESIMEEQEKGTFLNTSAAAAAVQATAWLSTPSAESRAAAATSSAAAAPSPVSFFNQYLLDELGMVKEVNSDGRRGDGS